MKKIESLKYPRVQEGLSRDNLWRSHIEGYNQAIDDVIVEINTLLMKAFLPELEQVRNTLEDLKRSGIIQDAAINWAIDRNGLTVEVTLIVKGIEKRIACVFSKEDGIQKTIMEKVRLILRSM